MDKHERARIWREKQGLDVNGLAEKIGCCPETVYNMERGTIMRGKKAMRISQWAFKRYQYQCAGLEAELRTGQKFDW